jgi:alpha-ketoglutarate-dependent taurine dioxygenase
MACIDKATFSWPWRNGDVMILDNLQVWHGRNPYQGPRDVQVALLD